MNATEDTILAEKLSMEALETIRKGFKDADEAMLKNEWTGIIGLICTNIVSNMLEMHGSLFMTTDKRKVEIFDEMLASVVRSIGSYELTKETIQ